MVTNLFLNAVNHAFPDGRAGTIRLSARRSSPEQVEIVFADDGVGMSEDVQRQAFDPFFTTRRNRGGTGLGLHIVYNLVTHRLGGRLRADSAPGAAPASHHPAAAAPQGRAGGQPAGARTPSDMTTTIFIR